MKTPLKKIVTMICVLLMAVSFLAAGCATSSQVKQLQAQVETAMQKADLLIALGSRFDDRITGRIADFSPNSLKAHVDIDPSSINLHGFVR